MLQHAGFIDGNELVEMNNLAVGYFPSESPEIGVYPPPAQPIVVAPISPHSPQETSSGKSF